MLTKPHAHGFCPWVASHWGHPKTTKFDKINMKINGKHLLKHKIDYLELALKITKMRYYGKEPPVELLMEANEVGSLAEIPDNELNNLLFDLDIQ